MVKKIIGIPKESILSTLESALLSAVRKKHGLEVEINIKIDDESGEISIKALKEVVAKVRNPNEEISMREYFVAFNKCPGLVQTDYPVTESGRLNRVY